MIGRQKFIAEIAKLLSGMTERDREATLAKYNRLFDEAPNEDDLIMQLGSPTRVAIAELRGYVPSEEPDAPDADTCALEEPLLDEVPDALAATDGLIAPEPVPEAIADMPAAPETDAPDDTGPEAEPLSDMQAQATASGETETGGEDAPEPEAVSEAVSDDVPETQKAPRRLANGGRLALYIIFGAVICIPATILLIALSLGILAFGAGLITTGLFTISLGFIGMTIFADVMLLSGTGLIIAAIGVPAAFFAVWFFSRVVVGFINLILRTGGKWCYEQTEEVPQQ